MIKGLYETHLFVENLERSIDFYSNKLELQKCNYESERRAVFFWIGKPKQFMLGLWEKPKEEIDIRHFAFECDPYWILNESVKYLKERHIQCRLKDQWFLLGCQQFQYILTTQMGILLNLLEF